MRIVRPALVLLFALATVGTATAFEAGASFDIGNLDFARDRDSTATSLPGDRYAWGFTVFGNQQLSDQLAIDLEFRNDSILRNVGYTLLTYTDRFFSLRLGPFFGLLNSPATILQSGLSTTVRVFVPGVVVLSLRSDNSLSARLVVTGDYIQEQSELSVGFFVPNAIPTVYVRTRRYTWKTAAGEASDSLTAYGFETDIFQKNIPYRVVLDFAYHANSRTFVEATSLTHSYGALILGADVSVELFDRLTAHFDLESSIYLFGRDELVGQSSTDRFLFRMSTGASWSF